MQFRLAMPFTQHIPLGIADWGNVIVAANRSQLKQTRFGKKNINILRRLSVVGSVAPPGTAWGAEGLRGNEANENKLMVLVGVRTRKSQS